jgi:hypothetical protein
VHLFAPILNASRAQGVTCQKPTVLSFGKCPSPAEWSRHIAGSYLVLTEGALSAGKLLVVISKVNLDESIALALEPTAAALGSVLAPRLHLPLRPA